MEWKTVLKRITSENKNSRVIVLDILHQIQESNSMQEERRYKIKNQNIESKIAKEQTRKRKKEKKKQNEIREHSWNWTHGSRCWKWFRTLTYD